MKEQTRDLPSYEHQIRGNKRRKLTDLSIEEKLDICDDLMVKMDYHENVSARYNIGRESIRTILKGLKKDPSYIRKQYDKYTSKVNKASLILQELDKVNSGDKQLTSIKAMREDIEINHGVSMSRTYINRFLNVNKALKFKKVKKVPLHANSLRNQYMRQQFAVKLIDLLFQGKRILAVDETWFGETNY